jgi:small-conductance mechanosensitive channel
MNIEAIEQRITYLTEQSHLARNRLAQLEEERTNAIAQINALEGALLDCNYWQEQLTDKNEEENDGETVDNRSKEAKAS